ncbi:MAG: glycosyltransferase family 2 protein [Rhodanobacteraceae bacterium]|nr:glycosyltransferase family 2 protein [Xanthomonadales bacterium]MCP5479157.1 glycosyltransferase family 2 protein [Rhodanobacteraceae bacterium]HPF72157.1 glycosyltransferase family 2 protein [Xanthomonadaceae bacterium]HRX99374.1 glycosyltransferase family 2 protein [Xanthomonadaceae bacterium]
MPARDERPTVETMVRRARERLDCDVLVVSDESRDGTADAARGGGARVLELPIQLGAWGATQAGMRFAQRHGYDVVITLDADGQHDPDCLPALMAEYERGGTDVVIGTFPERLSGAKRLAWGWFRGMTGLAVEDLTSGLRVYGPRALRVLTSPEATLLDYQDVGVLLLLRKYGLRVRELPTPMLPRSAGHSRVFSSWFKVAGYMLQTTLLCLARVGRLGVSDRAMRRAEGLSA